MEPGVFSAIAFGLQAFEWEQTQVAVQGLLHSELCSHADFHCS